LPNPFDGFFREFVERGHAHFQVLFFGVLDLVVTDAVEALDEHHDGGNAGSGNFGGVV
jgi:hypothetical protein